MPTKHVILISAPGLRPSDIDATNTPTMHDWANNGALASLKPTFPCVTSPVQASMMTGVGPGQHGVTANGFYYRTGDQPDPVESTPPAIEFWIARNNIVQKPQLYDLFKGMGKTSAVWHAQNIKDAAADFIVTPSPIHEDDGSTKLWCYAKPEGLYEQLIADLGHFPLQHYWGPMANVTSSQWIMRAAQWLIDRHQPKFHNIYIPHLDYAAQKFGPNSDQAKKALNEFDQLIAGFQQYLQQSPIAGDHVVIIASEYAMTDVNQVIYPNRMLREADMLSINEKDGAEHIDITHCKAFALVDHQFAHVYLNDENRTDARAADVAKLFANAHGIAAAYAGKDRREVNLDHPRAGDVILIAEEYAWFAYYWWLSDDGAPAFARTVDIHAKPGYDPVEMFFDPNTKGIPLDASLVKGSHGIPPTKPHHMAALLTNKPTNEIASGNEYKDTDVNGIVRNLLA